ncbi:glutathione S-transferase omega-1-like [Hyperolius riggenbachi]|uniref:glutathione S-transferase omega-1-like n=1 Tax=Hyperolius riggenbachi TaxID=752182 RepID=UPI0035A3CE2A
MSSSQKSLGQGSPPPGPVPKGYVRLYSMRFSPFAQKVLLVLISKGIKHEVVNINLKNKPDWFAEKSPTGQIPCLETADGKLIFDSSIICEYLDDAFSGTKLTPSDPYKKAQQRMLIEQFSAAPGAFFKIVGGMRNNEDVTEYKIQFLETFEKQDEMFGRNKTPFLTGDTASMVDYMLWPWFERFVLAGMPGFMDKTPHIKAWYDRMMQRPAVKATYIKPEVFMGFIQLYHQNDVKAVDYGLD